MQVITGRKNLLVLMAAVICFIHGQVHGQSPVGKWKTIDDETMKPRSIVEIFEDGGKLHGKIITFFPEPGEDRDPVCTECDKGDPRNGMPIIGMEILEGLEKDGDRWTNGNILDPSNGNVYSCYIELKNEDTIKLRGYIGLPIAGRTQYWYRTNEY